MWRLCRPGALLYDKSFIKTDVQPTWVYFYIHAYFEERLELCDQKQRGAKKLYIGAF